VKTKTSFPSLEETVNKSQFLRKQWRHLYKNEKKKDVCQPEASQPFSYTSFDQPAQEM
jgi:hypothetical protein